MIREYVHGMADTKPQQIRIRIPDADMPVIQDLAGNVLSITDVASLLLSAAIEAVKESGGQLHFPPKFQVAGPAPRMDFAAMNDKPSTALEAGHAEQIMFNHYREVVTKEAAAEFWQIVPATV